MRWVQASFRTFAMLLLLGFGRIAWGAVTLDFVNDEIAPVLAGDDCGNRSGGAFAASWTDRAPGACAGDVPPDWTGGTFVNVPNISTPKGILTGVFFIRDTATIEFPVHSLGACGSIDLCACDSAEVVSARVFNSFKRRACSNCAIPECPTPLADYAVEQKIGNGLWVVCTSLADCPDISPSATAQAFLRIRRTDAGSKCGFVVIREPGVSGSSPTAYIRLEKDDPCDLESNWIDKDAGNIGDDLWLVNLLQIKRNGLNGIVKFDVIPTPGASPVSFTVDTTGKTNAVIATEMDTKFEAAGLGLRTSVAANAAAAGSILDGFAPSPYETGQPVVVVENAGYRIAGINVKVVPGMEAIIEDLNPDPTVPTLSEWTMIILALLLLGSGYWLFLRQHKPTLV
ncbi:MAG TPA: hypothetical protein VFW45_15685 [Candidatus Polarisedimenticolia bacterium]|nr:hypothetical protein [Candidatus Polarisedimenticolia bacterium]